MSAMASLRSGPALPAGLPDMPAERALREDGVARDDGALERQVQRSRDLIGVGLHRQIADRRADIDRKRRENMKRFALAALTAFVAPDARRACPGSGSGHDEQRLGGRGNGGGMQRKGNRDGCAIR